MMQHATFLTFLLVTLAACKSPQGPEDLPVHPCDRLPESTYSMLWRATFKSIPYVRTHAFYGRYGGSGNSGGPPVDALDSICRTHDKVYTACRSLRCMLLADKVYAELLAELKASELNPEARQFRDRAVKFMRSKWAGLIAKPPSAWWRKTERPEAPFHTEEQIRAYYLKCQKQELWKLKDPKACL